MRFEIRKQERETNQSLIRRFTKRIKESGVLNTAKRSRFVVREKSKQMRRRSALRRLEKKLEFEKLKKLGVA